MNARERYLAIMACEPGVRPFKWEHGYWVGTIRRWRREGAPTATPVPAALPDGGDISGPGLAWGFDLIKCPEISVATNMDDDLRSIPINSLFCPPFAEEIVEDQEDCIVYRDRDGILIHTPKDRMGLPRFVAWPVHSRADWEKLKAERLQPTLVGRLPGNWTELVKEYRTRTCPLILPMRGGFLATPRGLLGDMCLLTMYYDDPQLVRDIISDLCDFWIALFDRLLDDVQPDALHIWEDMCYKNGPLISPAMVKEFMLPAYGRLTALLRERGVRIIHVDTDGDCRTLLPIFIEGGITGVFPCEVNAGMDIAKVGEAFPMFQLMGGINKMAIAAGPTAIDQELEAKVPFVLKRGGCIPYVDHSVPPDVSWENFRYYRCRLNEMIEASGT